jgi:hypothetical protein
MLRARRVASLARSVAAIAIETISAYIRITRCIRLGTRCVQVRELHNQGSRIEHDACTTRHHVQVRTADRRELDAQSEPKSRVDGKSRGTRGRDLRLLSGLHCWRIPATRCAAIAAGKHYKRQTGGRQHQRGTRGSRHVIFPPAIAVSRARLE